MTSFVTSSLDTLPKDISIPAANRSSSALHPQASILTRFLASWVDTRLEERQLSKSFDASALTNNLCLGTLMAQLLHEQLAMNQTGDDNILGDSLSDVAQIVNVLLENENCGLSPSSLSKDLTSIIDSGDRYGALEIASCVILKTYMKHILLVNQNTVSSKQAYLPMTSSNIPTFQLGHLSLWHTFLEVRSALLFWVNQQFQSKIDYICVDLVSDFSLSWRNGLALCLLIYCLNSSYISGDIQHWIYEQLHRDGCGSDYDDHTMDDDQTGAVLSYVFDIAKQRTGMFAGLTFQDILEMMTTGNEWCIMLYVYEFYMYGTQQKQSTDSLASDLQESLELVHSLSHTKNDKNAILPLHPLDDIDESAIRNYSQQVSIVVSIWNAYLSKTKTPSQQLSISVSTVRHTYDLFMQGLAFTQMGKSIQTDIKMVEATMNDLGSALTLHSLQELEYRVDDIKALLCDMENQFSALVCQQQRYSDYLQQLQEKLNLISGWASRIRTWMDKNDYIRERIQLWVDLIEERNFASDDLQCDAMNTMDLTALDLNTATFYYKEHEQLKRDVDQFEMVDDLKQLWEHIKQQAMASDGQQLCLTLPEIATLGISLKTLDSYDHLWKLIVDRELQLERLVCRLQWEHLFEMAVEWIFLKDVEIDRFLRTQALWCEQEDDGFNDATMTTDNPPMAPSLRLYYQGQGTVEQTIETLMQLEHDITDFDGTSFTGVLDAYQGMVDLFANVPGFLKQRQTGFEAAFGDLSKRCDLTRQAVEQQLVMRDTVTQFKAIKNDGDDLRQKLLMENGTMDGTFGNKVDDSKDCGSAITNNSNNSNNSNSSNVGTGVCGNNTTNTIELSVESFKESCNDFLAHAKARVPYLKAPTMSTAMGALDSQSTDATNDAVQNSLHAYGISLSLVSDGLDQLLTIHQHMQSLQQRVTLVCQQMERLINWMNERRYLIEKHDFDIYDNTENGLSSTAYSTSHCEHQNKNDLLACLEKEVGTITHRLQQMENDDLAKLFEAVTILLSDIDSTNNLSIYRENVASALERLKTAQDNIKATLQERSKKLDALRNYLAWVSHWNKSHQWILSATRKLFDFCVKKAKYSSSMGDGAGVKHQDIETALQSHQDRIRNIGGNHVAVLADLYTTMVEGIKNWEKVFLLKNGLQSSGANGDGARGFVSDHAASGFPARQSMVVQKYHALEDLAQYAASLVTQRHMVSNILKQVDEADSEGKKLRDSVTKSTQQIMKIDLRQQQNARQRQSPKGKVELFRQLVAKTKMTSIALEHPALVLSLKNGGPDSILSLAQAQQLQNDDAQILVTHKIAELETLDGQLAELVKVFEKVEEKKQIMDQYNYDILELTRWIDDQTTVLENRHLNVAAETMDELLNGASWIDFDEQHQQFVSMIGLFEMDQLKQIHDKVVLIVEDVATQSEQLHGGSLDATVVVTQNLGTAINNFTALQQKVADEEIIIDAVGKRIEWVKMLQHANGQLEILQRKLGAWCKKMDEWINDDDLFGANSDWQEEAYEPMLVTLYQDMGSMMNDSNELTKSTMAKVHLLYDTFVQCFPKLPRPTATPDHIEDAMASLDGLNTKHQEDLVSKNKELDIIQGYIQWNTNYKMVYRAIWDYIHGLNLFVTHTARWRPIASTKEHENGDNQTSFLSDRDNIHQQCSDLTQQLHNLRSRLDILDDDATTNNVNNVLIQHGLSQRNQSACVSRYILELACFMDSVIKQNEMVKGLLRRMSRTGGSLLLLLGGNTPDLPGFINSHTAIVSGDDHDQLIKQVSQHRSDITKVIYPIRPTIDYSNTGDSDMTLEDNQSYWQALDHTDNDVIRNVLTGNLMDMEHSIMEIDRTIQNNKQQHQQFANLIPLKQKSRQSRITVDTKTQKVVEYGKMDTQNGVVGNLTKSLSLNDMPSLPKQGGQQVLKSRSRRPISKIMPGQVGKYWIGNSQPRLIYCRVLKSNAVMARVGGGWVELSQFLLDHGCNDGSVILSESASSETISHTDNLEKSESCTSLTLSRSSGKSSNTRSLLPITGYTNGYQYVRIDEWGNHLALNMVRVDDYYFISQK